jgi:hypothetical protein
MWINKLSTISLVEVSNLNLRNDLHFALFTIDLLKDTITFKLKKDKSTVAIIKDKKELTIDKFMFWWQITRYEEIFKEETTIVNEYEKIAKSINKLQTYLVTIAPEEESKIIEFRIKIDKLIEHQKKEEPLVKEKLNRLSSFRNTCYSKESVQKTIDSILICLQNK